MQRALRGKRAEQALVESVHLAVMVQVPGDSVNPDFPQDASPQRVIQIRDQPFLGGWYPCKACQKIRESRGMPEFVRKSRKEFGFDVKPFPQWRDQIDALGAENSYLGTLRNMRDDRLNQQL